jgi:hypothetical protein
VNKYAQWRADFIAECGRWLNSNNLSGEHELYLANWIEREMTRWVNGQIVALATPLAPADGKPRSSDAR